MQAASATPDANYHDGDAGNESQERPALDKNPSANTVLANKDQILSMQRGPQHQLTDNSRDQMANVYMGEKTAAESEYNTLVNDSKTDLQTADSQVSTNFGTLNNSQAAQRVPQQPSHQERVLSEKFLARPMSQKGNRLRGNQRLVHSKKSQSVIKSTAVARGTYKQVQMGSTLSHAGRQHTNAKSSQSTS